MEYVLFFRIVFAHVVISFVSNRIPYRHLEKVRKHLQVCEAEIRFYERNCHIKKWKDLVPSAGPFDKRSLKDDSLEYLSVFIPYRDYGGLFRNRVGDADARTRAKLRRS